MLATPRHFAYIKIAEGCDHPCTFCVIPQYRGKFRSRRFESVISEATRLFAQGVREINLIGQDTTCYGEDLGLKDGLAHLLARLAQIETAQRKWIRFLYAYPNKITQKLLDTIAEHRDLVKYIDMPLQHASAPVLKRMKRGSSGDDLPEADRAHPPHHSGSGHPHQFHRRLPRRDGRGFRRAVPVRGSRAGSTIWACSPIPTKIPARSYALDGKVDGRTIQNRKRRLMAIQRKIARARNRALVGAEVPVLVEGPSPETDLLWAARMSTQAPEIDGAALINDFEGAEPRSRGNAHSADHRERTITTWWGRCSRPPNRRRTWPPRRSFKSVYEVAVPHLQKGSEY